jgi:hypothetical protein
LARYSSTAGRAEAAGSPYFPLGNRPEFSTEILAAIYRARTSHFAGDGTWRRSISTAPLPKAS